MSREQNLLRGITNKDLKQVVGKGFSQGWKMGEFTGTTHCFIIWPRVDPVGKVGISTTTSDRNAYRNVAKKMEDISGIPVLEKVNHRKPRGKAKVVGYTDTYVPPSQRVLGDRVDSLIREHQLLVAEFRLLSHEPVEPGHYARAKDVILRLSHIEDVLIELHQPIPTPNLHDIH